MKKQNVLDLLCDDFINQYQQEKDNLYMCVNNESIDKNVKLYIVQEGISYGSSIRTKSIFDLAGLNYMIRNEFIEKENILFFIAPPTHIKKFATGIGNCEKEMIIELFKNTHKELTESLPKVDDIADAYYMSCYAKKLCEEDQ